MVVPQVPDAFAYVVILFMLCVAGLYVYLLLSSARQRPVRQIAPMGPRIALLIVLLAAWALLPPVQRAVQETLETIEETSFGGQNGGDGATPGDRLRKQASEGLGYALTVLVTLALAGLGAAVVWVLRPEADADPDEAEESPPPPELAAGVELSIAELEDISEPRAAILACYRRLLSAVDEAGVTRRPSDAPFELLGRLLSLLGASAAAATRLTELFERARFSEHEIDEDMRSQALSALHEVRSALAAQA
jgi:hypothetical protein